MAYTTGTLTGKYLHFNGDPASGVVEIIPNSKALLDAEGNVILTGRVKVTLDETGAFSVTLPATDDATVEPAIDRQYTVVAKLRHQHLAAVTGIELATGETRDMADLTGAAEAAAEMSVWLTQEDYAALEGRVDTLETTPAVTSYNDLTDKPVIPTTAADVGADPAGTADAAIAPVVAELADKVDAADLDTLAAAEMSDPTSALRGSADAAFVGQSERPSPFRSGFMSSSKGGRVGTDGRVPVALRFDDWQDNIITLGLFDELKNRGLFGSIVLCSELGSQNWNQAVTWDQLRTWNRQYGMEVWSHGTDHVTPWDPSPGTYRTNLVREIVTSRETIEAQGIRVMGWAMPGVEEHDGIPGYGSYLTAVDDWDTDAGKLLTANYAIVETDMTGEFRIVPSDLRYGLAHVTVSDGETLARSKGFLDAAIALGQGIEFMCHAGNLGLPGNMTVADFKAFLDYIVTKRDAGVIEFVTPSTLAYCDPTITARRNLLANSDFTKPTQSAFLHEGTWYDVNGTTRQVVEVADGPDGSTAKVARIGGGFIKQSAYNLIGTGAAGQTHVLDLWARGVGGASSFRFYAQADVVGDFNFSDADVAVTTAWQRFRFAFTAPPTIDKLNLGVGYGFFATLPVEVAEVSCFVA